jgi:hypothetical protein
MDGAGSRTSTSRIPSHNASWKRPFAAQNLTPADALLRLGLPLLASVDSSGTVPSLNPHHSCRRGSRAALSSSEVAEGPSQIWKIAGVQNLNASVVR